ADGAGLTERHYIFLKRLCQVLSALGSQLCALLASDVDVETPANLGKYLEAFLAFTTHPSQFLRSSTQVTWGSLFRHEVLSKDPMTMAITSKYVRASMTNLVKFLRSSTQVTWGSLFRHEVLSKDPMTMAITSKYVRASMTNLVKVGFPSKTDSPSCEYSRADFDGDEDFNAFFNSFRAQQGEVVRNACKLIPLETFQMAGEWLQYQLNTPIDIGPTTSKTAEGLCSIFSPSYVQWEAMTFFTESVVSQLIKFVDKEKLPVDQGMELLQAVLNYETRDPLILSCVLTNVSTLFPFVSFRPEFLPQVLSKLFSSVTFEVIEESKPCFEMLYSHVKRLFSNELLLTQMEKCALMEALVLISNQFKNYEKQKAFLEELMAPVSSRWLSEEMTQVLSDPTLFLSFVGADVKVSGIIDDPTGINRSRISFCVYTILGVVKRSRWPSDLEEAKAGGFVDGYAPNGNPIYRNPCAEQVRKLLHNLLALIRWVELDVSTTALFSAFECAQNAVSHFETVGERAGCIAQYYFLLL
ncbi:UNVERIFIED_CONTAM: hypothetical protein FKN15_059649, partial [Acipenser sinensis]